MYNSEIYSEVIYFFRIAIKNNINEVVKHIKEILRIVKKCKKDLESTINNIGCVLEAIDTLVDHTQLYQKWHENDKDSEDGEDGE